MKNSQKGFVIPLLLLIVAVLLIGGAGYVYQQNKNTEQSSVATSTPEMVKPTSTSSQTKPPAQTTTSPTSDWKTYTNTKYGFSFKYPSNWSAQESSDGMGFSKSPIPKDPQKGAGAFAAFYVSPMYINKEGSAPQVGTPEVYHNMYYGVDSYNPGTQITAQWMMINGIPAFYHYVVGSDKRFPVDNRFVLYTKDLNFGFVLYAGTAQQPTIPTVYDPSDVQLMKEVIGTIKFTDPSIHFVDIGAEEKAANYSVFRDQSGGYGVYYPKSWQMMSRGNGIATTIKDSSASALPVLLTAEVVRGTRVDDGNGKTGSFTFYWDEASSQWKVDSSTNAGGTKTTAVKPLFIAPSGLQVFQGNTVFGVSNAIIPLTTGRFLLLSIDSSSSGPSGQKMIDVFANAFVTANQSLPINIISKIVSAEAVYTGLPTTGN